MKQYSLTHARTANYAVTYTPDLSPRPVNNTLHPDFLSCPSGTLYSTHPPLTTSYKNQPIPLFPPLTIKTYLTQQTPIICRCKTTQKTPDHYPPLTSGTNQTAAMDPWSITGAFYPHKYHTRNIS